MNQIQTEIQNDLRLAKTSIKVAVSWLTDILLIKELIVATDRGVNVHVVLSANELNIIRFELFQQLLRKGAVVNKEGSEEPEQGGFMHYKFYIIDEKIAKSGSYNWSVNAVTNREALDDVSVSKKLRQFDEVFRESVNFFKDIESPEKKRAELLLIERETNNVLTPEKLAAYRQTQAAIKEQEAKHKMELERIALQNKQAEDARKQAEDARKQAERVAEFEKQEKTRILEEQKKKEQEAQYKPKTEVKVAQVPPTSYGNE